MKITTLFWTYSSDFTRNTRLYKLKNLPVILPFLQIISKWTILHGQIQIWTLLFLPNPCKRYSWSCQFSNTWLIILCWSTNTSQYLSCRIRRWRLRLSLRPTNSLISVQNHLNTNPSYRWRIKIKKSKSIYTVFTLCQCQTPPIFLDNKRIPLSDIVKYLGSSHYKRLNWS